MPVINDPSEAARNQLKILFRLIHRTGEEVKNHLPNMLRHAIEDEAWRHFRDAEGKPFTNLLDWLAAPWPNGCDLGLNRFVMDIDDLICLSRDHPEVHRALVEEYVQRLAPGARVLFG